MNNLKFCPTTVPAGFRQRLFFSHLQTENKVGKTVSFTFSHICDFFSLSIFHEEIDVHSNSPSLHEEMSVFILFFFKK